MYCPNCGTKVDAFAKFCMNCGTQLQTPQSPPPQLTQTVPAKPASSEESVHAALKQFFKAPLFLTAVIFFTCGLLLSMTSLSSGFGFSMILEKILDLLDMESEFSILFGSFDGILSNIFSFISSMGAAAEIILNLPTILAAVGLWITFASAAGSSSVKVNASGFRIIKVLVILQCIVTVAPLVFAFFLSFTVVDYLDELVIYIWLILAIVLFLNILYYSKYIKTLGTVIYSMTTGYPSSEVSTFVAFLFISGGIINGLLSLTVIPALCSAVADILFGVLIYKYKGRMTQGFVVNTASIPTENNYVVVEHIIRDAYHERPSHDASNPSDTSDSANPAE